MQIKLRTVFIPLIALFLTFNACQSDTKQTSNEEITLETVKTKLGTFKEYYHKKGKYSLLVPEEWKIDKKKKEGCSFISNRENASDNFKEFLDIYIKNGNFVKDDKGNLKPENLSSKEWLNAHFDILSQSDNTIEINDEGILKVNEDVAAYKSFNKSSKGRTYQTTVYLISKDNKAYILTTIVDNSKNTFYAPRFKIMIESLKI